ncbi:hypothetical protein N7450_000722 [Penicillium hetheringtonii]|uniref:phosphoribosylglycinamide formyltransferase 1 n=1 Tax=Penicillium hetheringtonii TaxID=911720 RepID=A0AAD6H2V7_9EURO|nr:hypothetical protein N7450_000722 [Penicillium hetheringtonii]
MPSPIRATVLISGNGSNLQAVIDNVAEGKLDTTSSVYCRIARTPLALSVPEKPIFLHYTITLSSIKSSTLRHQRVFKLLGEEYDAELARLILADSPELVVCLGFMHILSPQFLEPLEKAHVRIINLHPALPGQFNGVNAIERAHAAWIEGRIDKTGVMIHDVISEVDMGKPILVKEIPFQKGRDEDLEAFETWVHETEWGTVIEGVGMVLKELQAQKQ